MKKKLLIIAFAVCVVAQLRAQTSAGNMMVSGNFYYSSTNEQGDTEFQYKQFGFLPAFGYFIADNIAVGAMLGITSNSSDNGATKTINTSFGFGPLARYYKFTANENFAFFGQARFLYFGGKTDVTPGGEFKTSTINFALSPGFSYFFTDHWAMDLSITGLSISSEDPNKDVDNDKVNDFDFDLSLAPSIGIRYHFGN